MRSGARLSDPLAYFSRTVDAIVGCTFWAYPGRLRDRIQLTAAPDDIISNIMFQELD